MIRLTAVDLPDALAFVTRFGAALPAELKAVARACGHAIWPSSLLSKHDVVYAVLRNDGIVHELTREDLETEDPVHGVLPDELRKATVMLAGYFLVPLGYTSPPPYCVILRRNATIMMVADDARNRSFYITSPQMSAHDRILDAGALEQEFPGMFDLGGQP